MNTLGHVFFANILLLFGAPSIVSPTTLLVTSIASVITDLDHILHLRTAMKTRRFKSETRTRWHELPGLLLAMSISIAIMLFSASLGRSLLIGFVSHYFLDLLTRPTRPFYPLSEKAVFLGLAPRNLKKLTAYDTVLTVILGVILIASLHGQGLLSI
ncbi:MAG: metal-dependent hydrolase [Candidatus Bathyarchaeota archaeon]|nr:metal-dependent hydrolase [Candidatus Bathyarchaeota archaeon]